MVTITEIKMIESQMANMLDWIYSEFGKEKVIPAEAIDHTRYKLSTTMMRYASLVFQHNNLVKQYEEKLRFSDNF